MHHYSIYLFFFQLIDNYFFVLQYHVYGLSRNGIEFSSVVLCRLKRKHC